VRSSRTKGTVTVRLTPTPAKPKPGDTT
jgi:hypothetical protein